MSAYTSLILTTILFSIYVVYCYRDAWERQKELNMQEKYAEAVLISTKRHFAELKDKEMLLVVDKGYGIIDSSQWEDELDNFACLVVEPTLKRLKVVRFESVEQKRKFMIFTKDMIKNLLCYDVLPMKITAKEYLVGRHGV